MPTTTAKSLTTASPLLSKAPLDDVQMGFGALIDAATVGNLDEQRRVISGVLNNVRIVNLYVPNGSSIGSEKYEYKLSWLAAIKQYLTRQLAAHPQLNVCGDFNIAPENKGHLHRQKQGQTHHVLPTRKRNPTRCALYWPSRCLSQIH